MRYKPPNPFSAAALDAQLRMQMEQMVNDLRLVPFGFHGTFLPVKPLDYRESEKYKRNLQEWDEWLAERHRTQKAQEAAE